MSRSTGDEAREEAGSAGTPPGREGDLSSLAFARGQTRALELIATGASLEEVLEFVIRTIEDQAPVCAARSCCWRTVCTYATAPRRIFPSSTGA